MVVGCRLYQANLTLKVALPLTSCHSGYKLPLWLQTAFVATDRLLIGPGCHNFCLSCHSLHAHVHDMSVHDMFTPRRGHTRLLLFCDTMALHIPTMRNNYNSVSTDLDTTAHFFFFFFASSLALYLVRHYISYCEVV
jgi:hypothetical protein